MNEPSDITEQRIIEIQRLIDKFQSEFRERTSDPDHFMSMSDIERLWEELKNNTEKIYSDMVMELLADVDEQKLISKKKRHFREQGINLTPDRRVRKEIFTLIGKISFERMVLRPADPQSRKKLLSCFGVKSIAPLDIYLGIDGLPCKMSIDMMLKCAFWAQNQCSYQLAEETIRKVFGYTVNDDTIRQVTNFVGRLVFRQDCRLAEQAWQMLESGKMEYTNGRKGVLYLEADGAALNTRVEDADGSTWRESKLGIVFSSDNIYSWTDKDGRRHHQIRKREYISYIGAVSEFKKHFLACAVRNGYGKYRQSVILSDGAG